MSQLLGSLSRDIAGALATTGQPATTKPASPSQL